jgi:GrpB-like predicted nucleotidyltransferase (UPF0157 family)
MMIDHSVLSDALNGYLDGKVVERGFWQSLDEEARTWLSRAIVGAKRKSVEVRICDYQEQWPKQFGYIHRGPCGVPDREAFRCVIDLPAHHLYACETDACSIREQLRFRNALRRNPELVAEYAELKRALADRYRHDRNAYTEAKTGFIRSVLESYRIN